MTKGWGRLEDKDCCILTENALKFYQQHHKVRLNAYHQPKADRSRIYIGKGCHIFPELLGLRL
jgi:hypothetical protein